MYFGSCYQGYGDTSMMVMESRWRVVVVINGLLIYGVVGTPMAVAKKNVGIASFC